MKKKKAITEQFAPNVSQMPEIQEVYEVSSEERKVSLLLGINFVLFCFVSSGALNPSAAELKIMLSS